MNEPSQNTLLELEERAAKFLRATSQNPEILATLSMRGYSPTVHQQGWQLYLIAANAPVDQKTAAEPSPAAKEAIATLSRDDAQFAGLIDAALGGDFADQAEFVTKGIRDADGAVAVANVATMLARIEALAKGRTPETTEADQKAVAALANVKLDDAERARYANLVAVAQTWDVIAVASVPSTAAERFEVRKPKLLDLWRWHRTWSAVAHALIVRRDWLISLGLAKRKKKDEKKEG